MGISLLFPLFYTCRRREVDDAGHYGNEQLGHGVTTERTYFAAQQRLRTLHAGSA